VLLFFLEISVYEEFRCKSL